MEKLNLNEPDIINIMLIGETGVGKSTFINALTNYFRFNEFESAVKGSVSTLIPTRVSVTDISRKTQTFKIGEDHNESQEVGAAATQDVKSYLFPIQETNYKVRLIDTPGMGDPRGIEQDDTNCDNILAYLAQLDKLHAFCFLMKPTTTRSTALFIYCVKQILTRLEKSASDNIVFVFTNTRGSNYTPGDTLGCLKKMIEEIQSQPPYVRIPLKDNVFSLDNEPFKYLLAIKKGLKFQDAVLKTCSESWNRSANECRRLLRYITGEDSTVALEPHHVKNTISINEARTLVSQLVQPLSEIVELIQDNIRAIEVQQEILKAKNLTIEQMKNEMFIPVITLEVIQLSQPVTVCTSLKCADAVKVGEVTKWNYRTRCHDPCYLTGVSREVVGDQRLLNCAAMGGQTNCQKCSCDYQVHMHVYYMTEKMNTKIVDENKVNGINDQQNAIEACRSLMDQMNGRIKEYEGECDVITKCTAKFAHFLQRNTITPFNDAYKEYLEQLILREKAMGQSANMELIKKLQIFLLQHTQLKKTFESNADNVMSPDYSLSKITPDNVSQNIQALFNLKHNGKKIRELYKYQKSCKNKEFKNLEHVVKEPIFLKSVAQNEQEREAVGKVKVTQKDETKASEDEEKKTKAKSTDEDDGGRRPKMDSNQNSMFMPYLQHGAAPGFSMYPVMQPPLYGVPPNHFQNPDFYAPPHQPYQHMHLPHQQTSSNGPYDQLPQGQQPRYGVSNTPPPHRYQNQEQDASQHQYRRGPESQHNQHQDRERNSGSRRSTPQAKENKTKCLEEFFTKLRK